MNENNDDESQYNSIESKQNIRFSRREREVLSSKPSNNVTLTQSKCSVYDSLPISNESKSMSMIFQSEYDAIFSNMPKKSSKKTIASEQSSCVSCLIS